MLVLLVVLITVLLLAHQIEPSSSISISAKDISIFHQPKDAMLHFEICVQKVDVHQFRSLETLLTHTDHTHFNIVQTTWCKVSATPTSRQTAICPWRCHILNHPQSRPPPPSIDLKIQFISSSGTIQRNFMGSSIHTAFPIQHERSSHVQLYTSFFITKDNQTKEHQLVVRSSESLLQAAERFVHEQHMASEWVTQLETNLIKTLSQNRHRQTQLSTTSKQYTHVVIGASANEVEAPDRHGYTDSWLLLTANDLNILDDAQWELYFAPHSLRTIVAEHVFEHLTWSEAAIASALCLKYLMPGGGLRLAVPDAYYSDPNEHRKRAKDIEWGHRILFNHKSLTYLLSRSRCEGLEGGRFVNVALLEWRTRRGFFYNRRWSPLHGFIQRSKYFDKRGAVSLIVDAVKGGGKSGHRSSSSSSSSSNWHLFDLESRHHPHVVKTEVEELLKQAQRVVANNNTEEGLLLLDQAHLLDPTNIETLKFIAQLTGKKAIDAIASMRQEHAR